MNLRKHNEDTEPVRVITSRLLKGGALLSDMRLLTTNWSENYEKNDSVEKVQMLLAKTTRSRAKDTYVRAFRPRFIEGSPHQSWRLAKTLEHRTSDIGVIRPFYYWITARSERLLYDFVTEELVRHTGSADREIRIEETISWIGTKIQKAGKEWTPTVQRKVARGVLAALRDFGILEGATRKYLAPIHLSTEAFAIIAFCLYDMGISGQSLMKHPDWRLFLLNEANVERLFIQCHQHGMVEFHVAGAIYRIEFPVSSFEEYVNVVFNR